MERLELVLSKAITVITFLKVRSVPLTTSVLQPEAQDTAAIPIPSGTPVVLKTGMTSV